MGNSAAVNPARSGPPPGRRPARESEPSHPPEASEAPVPASPLAEQCPTPDSPAEPGAGVQAAGHASAPDTGSEPLSVWCHRAVPSVFVYGWVCGSRVTTWNMGGGVGPDDLAPLFRPPGSDMKSPLTHHIVVVGTQECMRCTHLLGRGASTCPCGRSIGKSVVRSSKSEWEARILRALGPRYCVVRCVKLAATHIAVFVRLDVVPLISGVCTGNVSTGFLKGAIPNKGAVAVGMDVFGMSLLCVCSHLAAGEEGMSKVADRNAHFDYIHRNLVVHLSDDGLVALPKGMEGAGLPRVSSGSGLRRGRSLEKFDLVLWFGDMNYRVEGRVDVTKRLCEDGLWEVLLANDQLRRQMVEGRAFAGFEEGSVTFPPTYKFQKDAQTGLAGAAYSEDRLPSWTDRVLWRRGGIGPGAVVQRLYTSVDAVRTSDHRPVVSSFEIKVRSRPMEPGPPRSPKSGSTSRACIVA